MNAVKGKDDHDDEIRDQQCSVKRVPPIQMFKGLIGVVRLPIVAETVR